MRRCRLVVHKSDTWICSLNTKCLKKKVIVLEKRLGN